MNKQSTNIEEKIIEAAIECIERYGLKGTTNRKIAELAGVNLAAINYYFRSKDVLIQRCMEITLDNAFDWQDVAQLSAGTPQKRAATIAEHLLQGACNFPGLTQAHFYELVADGNYDSLAVKKINAFTRRLVEELRTEDPVLDEPELELAVAQVMAAVLMMSLMPSFFQQGLGIDLRAADTRHQFAQRLVKRLL